MPHNQPDLALVMPVYNEEAVIETVLARWHEVLSGLGIAFEMHIYDDGSRDGSLKAMQRAAAHHPEIIAHTKPNSGHGPTILKGYRENTHARWIFQTDSDDEMPPEAFGPLWEKRRDADFLLGSRDGRGGPVVRRIITAVARLLVRTIYGPGVMDANSPFRLMRTAALEATHAAIPSDTFAPNVIVSGMACLDRLRIVEMPVAYTFRQSGTVSLKPHKMLARAILSFWQAISFRFSKACADARRHA